MKYYADIMRTRLEGTTEIITNDRMMSSNNFVVY